MDKAWVVERNIDGGWYPVFGGFQETRNEAREVIRSLKGVGYKWEFRIRRWVREGEK